MVLGAAALAACARAEDPYITHDYDPARDPRADLALAIERAQAQQKRILLIVGGEWCVWCHILEDYLEANADVGAAFAAAFVILKVNYSDDNKNEDFLGAYPESEGYPDFFILDSSGAFLAQQGTGELEEERSYNRDRMLAFARQWSE